MNSPHQELKGAKFLSVVKRLGALLFLALAVFGFQNCGSGFSPSTISSLDASATSLPQNNLPRATPSDLSGPGAPVSPPQFQLADHWIPLPNILPGQMGQVSAVWTGTKMIYWQGSGVESFDPQTHQFATLSNLNPPQTMTLHVAVWTGSKMLIWGGYRMQDTSLLLVNDGYSYDLSAGAWSRFSSTNAPLARAFTTAVWTGSKMLVWGGGITPSGTPTNTGGIYDPTADAWTTMPVVGAPSARLGHSAIWTGSKMLIWGGYTNGSVTNEGFTYDPATGAWSPLAQIGERPTARYGQAALWTGSEMIVWGGVVTDGTGVKADTNGNSFLSDFWIFNLASGVWRKGASAPLGAGYYPASAWTGSQAVLLGGSVNSATNPDGRNGGIYY